MKRLRTSGWGTLAATALALPAATLAARAGEAVFHRGINLNGPAVVIDGRAWEAGGAPNVSVSGKLFENQAVPLKPPTGSARAQMIRSSVWGNQVKVEIGAVPEGDCQIFLHVWEDNHSEQFDLLVNGKTVVGQFHSGAAGSWRRLGPWAAAPQDGKLKIEAKGPSHGAANLSGVEIWLGSGPVPSPEEARFAKEWSPEQGAFFERSIRPLLASNCYECHSAGAEKLKGGLMLDSRAGMVKGGDTGPVVTPGQPDASLLIHAVRHTDPNLTMPPGKKLSPAEIADLEAWVKMGVPDPRAEDTVAIAKARSAINWEEARNWWSFRPVADPAPPEVKLAGWAAGDLDRFVLARMEAAGLAPAKPAERRALLRRATYDLAGLPPTPAELEAFLADDSPGAFAKVVDRLLASPAYGERWGRHWLDVVRYADTAGDNSDFPIPQMRLYRDWVISAFNRDLPYDEFIRRQLAGDLLPASGEAEENDHLVATGYLANARRFGSRVDDYPQHLTIEDTIDNLGRAFLGLTINCSRCHDHKFDPIPTADYYALYGIFNSTRYPWPGIELDQRQRDFVPMVARAKLAEAEAARKAHDEEKRRLEKAVQKLRDSLKETPADQKPKVEEEVKAAERAVQEHVAKGLPFDQAYAVAEGEKIGDAAIQIKGDPAKPGPVVRRRFLTVMGGEELPEGDATSGRRRLAEWIAAPGNPLTARVMANRIWSHHFGRGLAATPNDFGRQGKPPTHPELLDWLASRLVESGWSVKAMHRLVMLSSAYQMSSARSADSIASDPANEWLSSHPRRRLDAESIRDTLLALGGDLDSSAGGPHPFPPPTEWKFTQHNPFRAVYETKRRSVYLMTQRIQRHPYLAIFDGADPSASTAVRTTSTTPLQALFLLNDKFVHEQAASFARRLAGGGESDADRLGNAWMAALGRRPEPAEAAKAAEFLAAARSKLLADGAPQPEADLGAWEAMARVILRLNEFVYLD